MSASRFSAFIALRYLRARKSVQAIHIISLISMLSVGVLAASMIVLLSVFNGFEGLLKDLYKAFYPDVKITAVRGKWLDLEEDKIAKIKETPGVQSLSRSAEDMVLIFRNDIQKVATLKGVEASWFDITGLDSFIIQGDENFEHLPSTYPAAIFGMAIANEFGIDVNSPMSGLDIYYPQEDASAIHLEQSLNSIHIDGIGIFSAQEEFDARYIVAPLHTAQQLFDNNEKISSIEIKLAPNTNVDKTIAELQKVVGPDYLIQSQYEQNKTINMVMRSEKLAIYIIMSFILIIASFTLIGVLSMIAVDKKKDMSVLKALGASPSTIFRIFMYKGLLLSLTGAVGGLVLGLLICLGQQQYGWIELEQGFIIENYPVSIHGTDIVIVLFIILIVSLMASFFPANRAARQAINFREE